MRQGSIRLLATAQRIRIIHVDIAFYMPVEIVVDHWNPGRRRYRYETFCYGPKSCSFYRAGATRQVPGRKGTMWEEADWVDEEETAHREWDE